ncbi:MAG: ribonuclease D [Alphaproteobacteria bacterium]|nr:ribonuclease D [Alphaproteobacteria bacterium]
MPITLHKGDIPNDLVFHDSVAVDTEAEGLNTLRDRLCLVQISAGDGSAHLVQISPGPPATPNLNKLLSDRTVEKIFHFARFDMSIMQHYLGIMPNPIFCTKIASKLARTYSDRHSLRVLIRELINIEVSKEQQSSDWGTADLTQEQLQYAAADVLHLHTIRDKLICMLERKQRLGLARDCFENLPTYCRLDISGWKAEDIFSH